MDLEGIEAQGVAPVRPILDMIDSIQDYDDFWNTMDHLFEWVVPTFISVNVGMGVRVRSNYTLFVEQGATMLSDITYYELNVTDEGDRNASVTHARDRELLTDFYKRLMELTGVPEKEAGEMANATMEIEKMMAQFVYDEPYDSMRDRGPMLWNLSQLDAVRRRIEGFGSLV